MLVTAFHNQPLAIKWALVGGAALLAMLAFLLVMYHRDAQLLIGSISTS